MQFIHPEVLFALFLLIIPIIVHLFQLRKFRKEYFTNVKFLKRLSSKTRQSSKLKKWLVLATRLLLLGSIIFAFARPYFPSENFLSNNIETVIYLDNSFSMQVVGEKGRLLERNIQDLLEYIPDEHTITLITNTEDITGVAKNNLQEITYSPLAANINNALLRAQNKFTSDNTSLKKILLISDFEEDFNVPSEFADSDIEIYALPQQSSRTDNISIDTVYQIQANSQGLSIKAGLSFTGNNPGIVPVSVFDNEVLLGKSSIDFGKDETFEIEFELNLSEITNGRISIEDNGLEYDNNLYFTIPRKPPISIISIDEADSGFLRRIFRGPEFDYNSMPVDGVNYQTLISGRVIILNEVQEVSGSLSSTLSGLAASKEILLIIIPPAEVGNLGSNNFLRDLGINDLGLIQDQERLITGISFSHPIFSGVFEEQVKNFEYPKVQSSFRPVTNGRPILKFENNNPFLLEIQGNYFFTAPLNRNNSNFVQSPLIVPVFYNMAISALTPVSLYYNLGRNNRIEIPVDSPGNRIIKIEGNSENFIPQQQRFSNKIEIFTDTQPTTAGNFRITNEDGDLMRISYNNPRTESRLELKDISASDNIKFIKELPQFFSSSGFVQDLDTLWKWFVTFALIFLFIETLLLKYFK